MDDSALYTGIDGTPAGLFGNETEVEEVKELAQEQERLLNEIRPQLEDIINMIETEKDTALKFIADYVDNSTDDDNLMRGELKAAARYRKYLDELKTKFTLALNQVKK